MEFRLLSITFRPQNVLVPIEIEPFWAPESVWGASEGLAGSRDDGKKASCPLKDVQFLDQLRNC